MEESSSDFDKDENFVKEVDEIILHVKDRIKTFILNDKDLKSHRKSESRLSLLTDEDVQDIRNLNNKYCNCTNKLNAKFHTCLMEVKFNMSNMKDIFKSEQLFDKYFIETKSPASNLESKVGESVFKSLPTVISDRDRAKLYAES